MFYMYLNLYAYTLWIKSKEQFEGGSLVPTELMFAASLVKCKGLFSAADLSFLVCGSVVCMCTIS